MNEERPAGLPEPGATIQATPAPAPPAGVPGEAGDRIAIDDVMKVDMRVARIVAAEKVASSRKLMKIEVDLGTERRTLVAGIAEAYEAEALVGRLVGVVVNLKPARLMGIESNGMVLAASVAGGLPVLVGFDRDIPLGARIK